MATVHRPTLPISLAQDYPYRTNEGHWFRFDDKNLYLRGRVNITIGNTLTYKNATWTVNMMQYLDNDETMLTVAPLPAVSFVATFGGST